MDIVLKQAAKQYFRLNNSREKKKGNWGGTKELAFFFLLPKCKSLTSHQKSERVLLCECTNVDYFISAVE